MRRLCVVVSSAAILLVGFTSGLASASTLMLDFGPTTPTGANLTNSPLHTASGGAFTDTTWNVVGTADVGSGLLYSDGTAATGVALNSGASPDALIDLSAQPGSQNALGSTTNTGVYAGDSVGTDAIYQTYSGPLTPAGQNKSYVGVQVTGLAAGTYDVYVTGRNTNTTANFHVDSIDTFVGTGAAGDFNVTGYATANLLYPASYSSTDAWVAEGNDGENYVRHTISLSAGDAINIAVTGNLSDPTALDNRGFLNMIQITTEQVPEPSSVILLGVGLLACVAGRRSNRRKRK